MDPGLRLAAQLRTVRQTLGLTQTRMARKLGISQATLNRLESGSQNVTLGTLTVLARALRCDVVDLLLPPGPKSRASGTRHVRRAGRS